MIYLASNIADGLIRRFKARWDLWTEGDGPDIDFWAQELSKAGIATSEEAETEYDAFTASWDLNERGKPTLGDFCRFVRHRQRYQGSTHDPPTNVSPGKDPKVVAMFGRLRKKLNMPARPDAQQEDEDAEDIRPWKPTSAREQKRLLGDAVLADSEAKKSGRETEDGALRDGSGDREAGSGREAAEGGERDSDGETERGDNSDKGDTPGGMREDARGFDVTEDEIPF